MSLQSEVETLGTTLGLHVRAARLRRQWTTDDLANKLRVSERTVRKVEKGDPSVAFGTMLAACLLMGVDFQQEVSAHVATKRVGRRAPDIAASETDF